VRAATAPAIIPRMDIAIACPAPPGSRQGNRVTALRWGRMLRELGHAATVRLPTAPPTGDVLIALHARRCHEAVVKFRGEFADRPVVVVLSGTDLYGDLRTNRRAGESVELADRLVVYQPLGLRELPSRWRSKARVIVHSATPTQRRPAPRRSVFEVCVLAHLRPVKDPLLAARALRRLPPASPVRVTHAGAAPNRTLAEQARRASERDPRYRWLGELTPHTARRLLARSRLLVLSSRAEGGANVVCEALADGVPIVASRIPGTVGLLGAGYPGYFPVGDASALAELLHRVEADSTFYRRLTSACSRRAYLVEPWREREAWGALLGELAADSRTARGTA
jgi:putative glycosyltransferase (TIGR04348 family)